MYCENVQLNISRLIFLGKLLVIVGDRYTKFDLLSSLDKTTKTP